jgi:hypothetical protein
MDKNKKEKDLEKINELEKKLKKEMYEFTVNTKTNDAFLDGVLVGKFIDGRLIRNNNK